MLVDFSSNHRSWEPNGQGQASSSYSTPDLMGIQVVRTCRITALVVQKVQNPSSRPLGLGTKVVKSVRNRARGLPTVVSATVRYGFFEITATARACISASLPDE